MHPLFGYGICASVLALMITLKNPALALLAGAALRLGFNQSLISNASAYSKYALQIAIVLLGLNLPLQQLWQIGSDYNILIIGYVVLALAIGLSFGRLFSVDLTVSKLIASATAICGGTAMATLAPILKARAEQLALCMAIIFLLNALALFTFPAIGHYLALSQQQFGVWAALAIHDTSSVVATATLYGDHAAQVATVVKMGRTLWLIPLALLFASLHNNDSVKTRVPGFILAFVAASLLSSLWPLNQSLSQISAFISKALLVAALFFVGLQMSREMLSRMRGAVVGQAIAAWIVMLTSSLAVVYYWV